MVYLYCVVLNNYFKDRFISYWFEKYFLIILGINVYFMKMCRDFYVYN